MLDNLANGISVEGMESLIPVLVGDELELLPNLVRPGTHVLLADPERIRTRAADLVRTGNEFLAASWMAAATGGRAPIDLGSSAYRGAGGSARCGAGRRIADLADRAVRYRRGRRWLRGRCGRHNLAAII